MMHRKGKERNERFKEAEGHCEGRLERRSSVLVSCCEPDARKPASPPAARQLALPLLKLDSKCSNMFPVRDSNQSLAAVCQHHTKQNQFNIFCPRPLTSGQRPSLTLGGRILYKLGQVTIRDNSSSEHSIVLWNGLILSLSRQKDGSYETIPLEDGRNCIRNDSPGESELGNPVEIEATVSLCMTAIHARGCGRPAIPHVISI